MTGLPVHTTVPCTLTRLGVVVTPEPGNPLEAGVARLDRTVKPLANLCEDHVTQPPPDPASTADSGWRDDGVRLENATADRGRRRHDRLPP